MKELLEPYSIHPQETEKLDGYASTNFRIKSEGKNYVLKHYLEPNEFELIDEEERVLQLLLQQKLPFQLPSCIEKIHTYKDGSFSRLLAFIDGKLMSSVEQTTNLLENFGSAVGLMNTHLQSIESSIIRARELFWDMKHTLLNAEKVSYIEQPEDRKVVNYYLDLFEQLVVPKQRKLRHGIIHSDLNDNNIFVKDNTVTGIIDFGDITYSPLIYEVAIALTYIMLANESDPFEKARAFLQGYHKILPLKKEEIELLYLLIPSRLCVSVCNSAKKKAEGEDTEYVLVSERPAWRLLHKWLSINPIWINSFFLESLQLEKETLDIGSLQTDRKKFTGKSLGTSYNEPIYMTGGAFQYMYDHLGNTYLDAYNNIPHVGHCHPNLSKVITKQVRSLNTNTRYLYPQLADYAKEITKTLPNALQKIFYVNSGSAASDLAIRMAQTHTKRSTVAILQNGYHGNTLLGISVSDYKHNGKGGDGKPDGIITLPLPNSHNALSKTGKEYAEEAIDILKKEIDKGNTPSALIAEPISGCGGQVPLAEDYLKILKPFLEQHDILLIVDEVQTGFGRLGNHFWGFEMHDIVPDIIILGKPMGNGHPIAAVVTTQNIADTFANGMEFFTSFGGNPVSCAVALELLNIIKEEDLPKNAARVGDALKNGLIDLQKQFDCLADVRGEGLFLGVEFIDKQGKQSEEIANFIKEDLKKRFILVGTDGPYHNVIKIKPPLCFDLKNVAHFLTHIEEAIQLATLTYM
ncbi:aminotransferase class III-fold pyridoxal phosphate-dependent enzyme [Aquimarina sp. D1M17]|uniref:aminotransferase class III-fold pyridoxal phosphate-dependent enzyme n=1 Tax=Aquimarina acroporae TaxID=2937283 RepID=UPI0020C05810|nr:aminotransferase class III-fold pyridoxal phosphate-dependent enzyme [Aquimarina acroporae]MCK8521457.1 aminotransferase class III-fold pyridoxal phosphate-dependent enzyme [Aquimarina acroporae]